MAAFKQLIASEAKAFKKNNKKSIQSRRVLVNLSSWLFLECSEGPTGVEGGRLVSGKQTQITHKSRPPECALATAAAVQLREWGLECRWHGYSEPDSEESIQVERLHYKDKIVGAVINTHQLTLSAKT